MLRSTNLGSVFRGLACFFLVSWMFISSHALAISKGYFVGLNSQGIIMVVEKDAASGGSDNDPYTIYEAMEVPVQDSFLGPGKAIVTADRELNFVCAHRTSGEYQCSITINAGKDGKVSKSKGNIYYRASGTKGADISKLFKPNSAKGYYFESTDQKFKVWAYPEEFTLSYQE